MKYLVSIRTAAEIDLAEAHDWYEQQRTGLGDEFLLIITETLTRLELSPGQFPVYHQSFRRAITERFPYKIFFQIEGDTVIVFRVLHAARDHTWVIR